MHHNPNPPVLIPPRCCTCCFAAAANSAALILVTRCFIGGKQSRSKARRRRRGPSLSLGGGGFPFFCYTLLPQDAKMGNPTRSQNVGRHKRNGDSKVFRLSDLYCFFKCKFSHRSASNLTLSLPTLSVTCRAPVCDPSKSTT